VFQEIHVKFFSRIQKILDFPEKNAKNYGNNENFETFLKRKIKINFKDLHIF